MSELFAGRYELLRLLGKGGMGEVFLARDLAQRRECALKRITADTGVPKRDAHREFELLTRLRHPAVVAVFDLGESAEGTPYYTMEYVPGAAADRAIGAGDWPVLFFFAAEVAGALEALHGQGLFHGDLKPANVLVVPGEPGGPPAAVRLLDFGLADVLGSGQSHRGTAGYAAPEVVLGKPLSASADLYGLGSTLYTLIAGRAAFEAGTVTAMLARQSSSAPDGGVLEEAGAPAGLVRLVLRLMARSPTDRPRDAREVRRELEQLHPAARRPLEVRLRTATIAGCERELAHIEHALARPGADPRVIVICGDAGAGKTTIATELVSRLSLAGRAVFSIACGTMPAVGEAALALLRQVAAAARSSSADGRVAAGELMLARGDEIGSDRDLETLTAAASSWRRAIDPRRGAAIVVLDDADHLDPLSRALIRRLALDPDAPRTLWVWTRRGGRDEGAEDERALVEAGLAERLPLGPLDREGAGRLLAARLNAPVPVPLESFLWARAHGHPGLSVELLRHAARTSALRESDAGWVADASALESLALPESFEAMLALAIQGLPAAARSAAGALAVLGGGVSVQRLRSMVPDLNHAALEALLASRLAVRGQSGDLTLASPGFADRIAATLESSTRREFHRAAVADGPLPHAERFRHWAGAGEPVEALAAAQAAFSERPDVTLAQAAARFAEHHATEQAAVWHEHAARELAAAGRYAAAIPHLERALETQGEPEDRTRRMYQYSNACLRAGRMEEVAGLIEAALEQDLSPAWRSRFYVDESVRRMHGGDLEGAAEAAERAFELAEADHDDEAIGFAAQRLAMTRIALGRAAEAEGAVRRAEEAFRAVDQVFGRLRVMITATQIARHRHKYADAERLARQALEEARTRGLRLALEETLKNLAAVLWETGHWNTMRDLYAEAARIALEDQRPSGATIAVVNLALADALTGRAASASRQGRAAVRLAHAFMPRALSPAWRALAEARRSVGRTRASERAALRALDRAAGGGAEELAGCRASYAKTLAATGRWKECGGVCDHALPQAPANGVFVRVALGTLSGRAALRTGDYAKADSRLTEAEALLEGRSLPYPTALVHQLRAESALVRGRFSQARRSAERALKGFAELTAGPDRAHALLEFGRLSLAAEPGGASEAGEWLDHAATAFESLGDRRAQTRALSLRVECFKQSAPAARGGASDRNLIEAVSQLLHSLSELRELAQRAMQLVVEQLGAERGVLLLADAENARLTPIAEYGGIDPNTRSEALIYSRRAVQRVTESGDSFLVREALSDRKSRSDSMVDLGLQSILCVPMFLGGRVIGAVYLDSRTPGQFSDGDRGLLEGFAHLMAVAIEKSRGDEEVRRTNEILVGENLSLRHEATARFQAHRLIGMSQEMQRVRGTIERVALTPSSVLLTGENGTGKELIARIVHHTSRRRLQPFVAVNCGAIPESLLESELFGILPNVATGVRGRAGRFKQADGGTLFLDEIGDMPLKQQVALLSALANREITPVGGGKAIPVDVRVIAATNRDLRRMVEQGSFREDLFYRLNVIPIEVPPLRDRKADIPMLAQHFVAHYAKLQERPLPKMSPKFMAVLMQSDWPGNVREVQNYIERVMAMNPGAVLHPHPLPRDLEERGSVLSAGRKRRLKDAVEELEKRLLEEALDAEHGNQSRAAARLGMSEQSMRYRIRRFRMGSSRQKRRLRKN